MFMNSSHTTKKVDELRVSCDCAFNPTADGLFFEDLNLAFVVDFIQKFIGQKHFCILLQP
jgi:hypothetical protein